MAVLLLGMALCFTVESRAQEVQESEETSVESMWLGTGYTDFRLPDSQNVPRVFSRLTQGSELVLLFLWDCERTHDWQLLNLFRLAHTQYASEGLQCVSVMALPVAGGETPRQRLAAMDFLQSCMPWTVLYDWGRKNHVWRRMEVRDGSKLLLLHPMSRMVLATNPTMQQIEQHMEALGKKRSEE